MTDGLTVSVVIVSRGRPAALRRCLLGVSQLLYTPFEVVVVADPPGCETVRATPHAAHVKLVPYDTANISAARNLGIAAAVGDIVAFIDDDAVPEPTWLTHLAGAFMDPRVALAGGFVRGRNGISFQSQARSVDGTGATAPLPAVSKEPVVLIPSLGRGVRTEGTNMAVRRAVLAQLGGFDERYRFFLDETDLNMRAARAGLGTAIVPLAEVHHGYLASSRRRSDRTPRDLSEIGASWAVFLNAHCAEPQRAAAWTRIRASERQRALRHMVRGTLEPRDVRRLMAGLDRGYDEGQGRLPMARPDLGGGQAEFLPFPSRPEAQSKALYGRTWTQKKQRAEAAQGVADGSIVSVFRLSATTLYHRVTFSDDGYWEQTGGIFGRSDRDQPMFRLTGFRKRCREEAERVSSRRALGKKT